MASILLAPTSRPATEEPAVVHEDEDEEEVSLTAIFLAHFCSVEERCRILRDFGGTEAEKVGTPYAETNRLPKMMCSQSHSLCSPRPATCLSDACIPACMRVRTCHTHANLYDILSI